MDRELFRSIQNRRNFFKDCAGGIGIVALAQLMQQEGRGAVPPINPLAPKIPHFAPRAKNVIFLFMEGGPSQLDLFDPKPEMARFDGQALPESMRKDLRFAFIKPTAKVWASHRTFRKFGQSGMEFSDWLPKVGACADDLCMVRSMR